MPTISPDYRQHKTGRKLVITKLFYWTSHRSTVLTTVYIKMKLINNLLNLHISLIVLNTHYLTVIVKAHSHYNEIVNEAFNDDRWPTVAANVSRLTLSQDQTLLDSNDNMSDTSGSHWTTIKTNSSQWLPTNSYHYYIIKIYNIYY